MGQENLELALNYLKALANESRLKIIGILANGERTVSELADMLDVKEPTVSQHLDMLKQVGLVSVRPDGNLRYYSFNAKALHETNKAIFSDEGWAALVGQFANVGDDWERKVLKTYFDGERLTQLPAQRKKMWVVVKWLADKFAFGVQYTEKEVNAILMPYHAEEYVTLRRELIDYKFLKRDHGIYWRATPEETATAFTPEIQRH